MPFDRPSTNREIFAAVQERAKTIGVRQELGLTGTRAGWACCSRVPGRAEDEFVADVDRCAKRTLGVAQLSLYRWWMRDRKIPLVVILKYGFKPGEIDSVWSIIESLLGQAYRTSGLWPVSRYFDATPAPKHVAVEIRAGGLRPPLTTSEAA